MPCVVSDSVHLLRSLKEERGGARFFPPFMAQSVAVAAAMDELGRSIAQFSDGLSEEFFHSFAQVETIAE